MATEFKLLTEAELAQRDKRMDQKQREVHQKDLLLREILNLELGGVVFELISLKGRLERENMSDAARALEDCWDGILNCRRIIDGEPYELV